MLIWLLGICNLYGQERVWTLEECLKIGEESSLDMIVAQLQTRTVVQDKQSVASRYLPDVSINGS